MNKLLGILITTTFVSFSYATEGQQNGPALEEARAHAISMLDMRIKALQESKSCMTLAKNKEDMHACRKEAKEDMKEFKGAREEKRKEFKEKREEWKKKRKESRGDSKRDGEESEVP